MDTQTIALLLKELGEVKGLMLAVRDDVKDIKPQLRTLQERQTRHTTILTLAGSVMLFMKDKILSLFSA